MNDLTLVLEGGAFRSLYTSGVLDVLLKNNIDKLEAEGRIMVIQPKKPVEVTRLERDKTKLQNLYDDGVKDMEERLEELVKRIRGELKN